MHEHDGSSGHSHHMAHLDLMPMDAHGNATTATHVAVNNGDWFNPSTWADGVVPGDGALVHIPDGVSVTYEGASDAKLFMVRVDGALDMYAENGVETKMIVDTMITSNDSHLGINADQPTDGTVDIIFTEGSPAAHADHYTDHSDGDGVIGRYDWDPEQLSLGLIASGDVSVKGKAVDAGIQLAEGPQAGATEITFNVNLEDTGWAVGQQIAIGGTKFLGDDADGKLITQDEVRTITSVEMVDGKMVVGFDTPLEHDHTGPADPYSGAEITGFVGNLSRNVTIGSEVADQDGDGMADRGISLGETLGADDHYVTQRGHVMFMHNDDVSVLNTSFFGLGRTDKSYQVDDFKLGGIHGNNRLHEDNGTIGKYDPDLDIEIKTPADEVMNQRGRYPVHLHEANKREDHDHDHHHGVLGPCPDGGGPICQCGDQDGDGIVDHDDPDYFDGAYLAGNVVWGSPGWGIVQHSSDAVIDGNVTFDVAGSAYVAELGDEAGRWTDNLAMGTFGAREEKPTEDAEAFNEDAGASGIGFYLKARAIDMEDNVAQGAGRAGWFYHTNGVDLQDTKAVEDGILDTIAQGRDTIPTEDVPISVFDGNMVIGAREGIRITTDPSDAVRKFNDVWSHLKNFTAIEVDESGISITYSSKYVLENFTIIGTEDKISTLAQKASSGFYFKTSVSDITVIDSHVSHFDHAVTNWSFFGDRQEYRRGLWDPRSPSDYKWAEIYEGMGQIGGIENPIQNLFNNHIVGLTFDDIQGGPYRYSSAPVELADGTTTKMRGIEVYDSVDDLPGQDGVEIELLGDSRDGGLVALWREDIAEHPNQRLMLQEHIPLAYQDTVYLNQVHFEDGSNASRWHYNDYEKNINADIWSGTILEFAKEDAFGRQVYLYGDFSPLDPDSLERTVTNNERLVISKEMIDGTLQKDGFYHVGGIDDVKFVVVNMGFTNRLTGEIEVRPVLIALDLAWELPENTQEAGLLFVTTDMIVAPQYRVFDNGELVDGRLPIVLGEPPEDVTEYQTGYFTSDQDEDISTGAGTHKVNAGGGHDIVRTSGEADDLDGGSGDDALFGGDGADRITGGGGNDLLDGDDGSDVLTGGDGDDQLQGGRASDTLDGGDGRDVLIAGHHEDTAFGGAGDDILDGGSSKDRLFGGHGNDLIDSGTGHDRAYGGGGDDVIAGHDGNDRLYGGNGSDLINGGDKKDFLVGGSGHDHIQGEDGDDFLQGQGGHDLLEGGRGNDQLHGQSHQDALSGGSGQDKLFGGRGDDVLAGGTDDDELSGGEGADRFVFDSESDNDVITDFEDGVDSIEFMIQSFDFDDLTISQDGADAMVGHGGGTIRLLNTDADTLDQSDFGFGATEAF